MRSKQQSATEREQVWRVCYTWMLENRHRLKSYALIQADGETVGAIRVVDKKETGKNKRISPLFILPEYQGRGLAQQAMLEAERIHGGGGWELDTILQEKGNCHLYEKMGYRQTGKMKKINDRLTLVFYEKEEKP